MPTISYAITAVNEHEELERLLDQINKIIRDEDEIVVQLDTKATDEVAKVAIKYNVGTKYDYHRVYCTLNGDFSLFKNNLKNHCTRDYIFFIDADEFMSINLEISLPEILELNPEVDLFSVPRINTVKGLTQEHIQKWRWNVDKYGYINYPDYQSRIIKNKPEIIWKGRVHERIVGYKTSVELPPGYELLHPKTIDRQEKQNQFYSIL